MVEGDVEVVQPGRVVNREDEGHQREQQYHGDTHQTVPVRQTGGGDRTGTVHRITILPQSTTAPQSTTVSRIRIVRRILRRTGVGGISHRRADRNGFRAPPPAA
jgi:hypothetical protein